jgi:hypothetical protein
VLLPVIREHKVRAASILDVQHLGRTRGLSLLPRLQLGYAIREAPASLVTASRSVPDRVPNQEVGNPRKTRNLTMDLKDLYGASVFSKTLKAAGAFNGSVTLAL